MKLTGKPLFGLGCFILATAMPSCGETLEIAEQDIAHSHAALIPLPVVEQTHGAMCSIAGGCRVILEGQKFRGSATRIYVDGVLATRYFEQTSTRQVFEAPAAKPGRLGQVDVVVSNDNRPPAREQKLVGAFFYFADTLDFLPAGAIRTPAPSRALVVEDFDGDKRRDIAVISEGRDFVDVYLGQLGGRYAAPVSFPAGRAPVAIAAADLNVALDRIPDLAVVSEDSDSLTLLLSNGSNPFNPDRHERVLSSPPAHHCRRPSDVLLADLTNDGKLDVAVSCRGGDGISPQIWGFLGDGMGGLATPYSDADYAGSPLESLVAIAAAPAPYPMTLELTASHAVNWRAGRGGATFGDAQPVKAMGGRLATTMVAADLNGDSTRDLLVIEEAKKQVLVMETITGTGVVPPRIAPLPLRADYRQLFVADVNGDGKPDILATSGAASKLSTVDLFLGNGGGTFGAQQAVDLGIPYRHAAVADVDGNGYPDLILMGAELPYTTQATGEEFLFIALNDHGNFRKYIGQPTLPNPEVVASADFDGDKELDLAVVSRGMPSQVQVWKGLGSGGFAPIGTPLQLMETLDLVTIVPAAPPHLAVGDSTTGSVKVLWNVAGSLKEGCKYAGPVPLVSLSAGHVFGMPKPEIVVVSGSLLNFVQPADRGSCPLANPKVFSIKDVLAAVAVDLGGGKQAELVIARWNAIAKQHEISVRQDNGMGVLKVLDTVRLPAKPTSLLVAELSDDRKPDVVVLHADVDQATVLLQEPTMLTFKATAPQPTCSAPEAAWAADLNQDLKGDLVVACVGGMRTVQPYYGDGRGNLAPARRAIPWTPLGSVELLASGGKPWLLLLDELTGALTSLHDASF